MTAVADLTQWTDETLTMLGRLAAGTPAELAAVVTTLDSVREALPAVVAALRANSASAPGRHGHAYTWQEIADALGVTRQAATERFGRVPGRHTPRG